MFEQKCNIYQNSSFYIMVFPPSSQYLSLRPGSICRESDRMQLFSIVIVLLVQILIQFTACLLPFWLMVGILTPAWADAWHSQGLVGAIRRTRYTSQDSRILLKRFSGSSCNQKKNNASNKKTRPRRFLHITEM